MAIEQSGIDWKAVEAEIQRLKATNEEEFISFNDPRLAHLIPHVLEEGNQLSLRGSVPGRSVPDSRQTPRSQR